jgi:elongation factor P
MYSINDLKTGMTIRFRGHPAIVLYSEHSKSGRGGGIMRTKLKNLDDGSTIEHTFKGSDKIEELDLSRKKAQYLYRAGGEFHFMDPTTYDQFGLNGSVIGGSARFMLENQEVVILYADDKPINLELPIKMTFEVTEADPGAKGNTVSTATKNAKIETGIDVQVPLFIESGDKIVLDTRTGKYVERSTD